MVDDQNPLATKIDSVKEDITVVKESVARLRAASEYFKEAIEEQKQQNNTILNLVRACPESAHILVQSEKIEKLKEHVDTFKGIIKFWGVILALVTSTIAIATTISTLFLRNVK